MPQLASAFSPLIQTSFSFAFITRHSQTAHAYKVPPDFNITAIYTILNEGPRTIYYNIIANQMTFCPKSRKHSKEIPTLNHA